MSRPRPLNPQSPAFRADRRERIVRVVARRARREKFADGSHLDDGTMGDVLDDVPGVN